uniref:IS30 family transposase n=1 Tax=Rugamonas sp. TaxID=1926287 RepID=UPI0025CE4E2D
SERTWQAAGVKIHTDGRAFNTMSSIYLIILIINDLIAHNFLNLGGLTSNRSSVGTLVERTTGFVVLAKMDNATTKAVVDSFSAVLNREPAAMRKTMTYDQGREMHGHKILTERTGVQIYFADPHSPWQRGSNENTNGLLRQYMPKGSDLSIYSQEELDAIALSLNTRPRARLGYESPLVVYTQHSTRLQHSTNTVN